MHPIADFRGNDRYLSNFHIQPFYENGIQFHSVENYYQLYKGDPDFICTNIPGREETFLSVMPTCKPSEAKKLGRQLKLRENFMSMRIAIMAHGIYLKFTQNPGLLHKLLSTGHRPLIEGNMWHDNFWGDCRCANMDGRHKDCLLPGKNMLGRLLMLQRAYGVGLMQFIEEAR